MITSSWPSGQVFLQTRPLPLQGAPNPPPVFWGQFYLLKLTYLYVTAGSLTRASEWIQKTSENAVVRVTKQAKMTIAPFPVTF